MGLSHLAYNLASRYDDIMGTKSCRQPEFMQQTHKSITDPLFFRKSEYWNPPGLEYVVTVLTWYSKKAVYHLCSPMKLAKFMVWGPIVAPFQWLMLLFSLYCLSQNPKIQAIKRRTWIHATLLWMGSALALTFFECTRPGQHIVDAVYAALAPLTDRLPTLRFSCFLVECGILLAGLAGFLIFWGTMIVLAYDYSLIWFRSCKSFYNDLEKIQLEDDVAAQQPVVQQPPAQEPPAQQQPAQQQEAQQTTRQAHGKAPAQEQAQQQPAHEPEAQRSVEDAQAQASAQTQPQYCARCAALLSDTATQDRLVRERSQSSSADEEPEFPPGYSPSPAYLKAMACFESVQRRFDTMRKILDERDINARIAGASRRVLGPNDHLSGESSAGEGSSSAMESELAKSDNEVQSETGGDQERSHNSPTVQRSFTNASQSPTVPAEGDSLADLLKDDELDDDSESHVGGDRERSHNSSAVQRSLTDAMESPTSPVEGESLADLLDGEELDGSDIEEEDEDEGGVDGAVDVDEQNSPRITHSTVASPLGAGSSPRSQQPEVSQGSDGASYDREEQSSPQAAESLQDCAVDNSEENLLGPQQLSVEESSGNVSKSHGQPESPPKNQSIQSPRSGPSEDSGLPHTPSQQIGLVDEEEENTGYGDSSGYNVSEGGEDADGDSSGGSEESSEDSRFFLTRNAHLAYQKAASFFRRRPQQSDAEQDNQAARLEPALTAEELAEKELFDLEDSQYMVDNSDYEALAITVPAFMEPVFWKPENKQQDEGQPEEREPDIAERPDPGEGPSRLAEAQSDGMGGDEGTPPQQLDGSVETQKAKGGNEELKILQSDQFVDKDEEAEMSKDAENFARQPKEPNGKERAKDPQSPPLDLKVLAGAQSFIEPDEVAKTSRALDAFISQSKAEKQTQAAVSAGLKAAVEDQFDVDDELLAKTAQDKESFARKGKERANDEKKAQADLNSGLKAAAGDQFGVDSDEEREHIDSINEDIAEQQQTEADGAATLKAAHDDQFGMDRDEEREHIDSSLAFAEESKKSPERKPRRHRRSFLVWDDDAGKEVEQFYDEEEDEATQTADALRGASEAQYFGDEYEEEAEEHAEECAEEGCAEEDQVTSSDTSPTSPHREGHKSSNTSDQNDGQRPGSATPEGKVRRGDVIEPESEKEDGGVSIRVDGLEASSKQGTNTQDDTAEHDDGTSSPLDDSQVSPREQDRHDGGNTSEDDASAPSTYADVLKASSKPDGQAQDETAKDVVSPTHSDGSLELLHRPNADEESVANTADNASTIISPTSDNDGLVYVPTGPSGVVVHRKARTESDFSVGEEKRAWERAFGDEELDRFR